MTDTSDVVDTGYGAATAPPEVEESSDVLAGSLLDQLRSEAQERVVKEPFTLRVPARPNMQLVFDVNVELSQVETYRRSATSRKGKKQSFDLLKFSQIVLAALNTSFIYRNEDMNMTLHDKRLWDLFNAPSYFGCTKAMFGNDPDIIEAATEVMRAAGYGDADDDDDFEEDEEDPSTTS